MTVLQRSPWGEGGVCLQGEGTWKRPPLGVLMENRWSDHEAQGLSDEEVLVYQSRLLGADPGLVLWGGGNTSLKGPGTDFRGREVTVMHIKASGFDMKSCSAGDFPALRLDDIFPLFERASMSDEEMVAYLGRCILDPGSPRPSIETLLHAFLPYRSIVHTHADAVIALTNSVSAEQSLEETYQDAVRVVEYLRPGFALAKRVGEVARANPGLRGVVLSNHGLLTWGDTPKAAYDTHIELVARAEEYLNGKGQGSSAFGGRGQPPLGDDDRRALAARIAPTLRGLVGRDNRVVLRYDDSPQALEYVDSTQGKALSGIGPATPDHVIRTKGAPLWMDVDGSGDRAGTKEHMGSAVDAYVADYARYYNEHSDGNVPMLDPYPRIVLAPGLGMWSTGKDAHAAQVAGEMYRHTIDIIRSAECVGGYTSIGDRDIFGAEYWPLELYKLTLAPPEKELERQVGLVTGGAQGIGRAIACRLAAEGVHVVVTDLDEAACHNLAAKLNEANGEGRALGLRMDVTDESEVGAAFDQVRLAYGGLDILVSNAGIAPVGALDQLPLRDWQRAMDINATGHFLVARQAVAIMREQALGGSMVFVGTKNVPSPGKDFGAYSASKAAEVQMAKVLAIENGEYGIRCNIVNPDAIFQGSGLWSQQVREQRAQAHGIPVDELEDFYRKRNLLQASITAEDVAESVLFLAGPRSSKTTGAMIPVDGGVRDAFPR